MSKGTLAIFGAGGHAKSVADLALQSGWDDIVFYADEWPEKKTVEHWPLLGDMPALIRDLPKVQGVIVGIGNCAARHEKQEMLAEAGAPIVTIVHPTAVISRFSTIASGSTIFAGVIIKPFTSIGKGVILNSACTIAHDCRIGNYVHVAPGANVSGNVTIGCFSWIGVGATVRECITVGNSVTVGASAAVVNSLSDAVTAVGVPAKAISR